MLFFSWGWKLNAITSHDCFLLCQLGIYCIVMTCKEKQYFEASPLEPFHSKQAEGIFLYIIGCKKLYTLCVSMVASKGCSEYCSRRVYGWDLVITI